MDCVTTGSPTYAPTTSEPTMAPTSICLSLSLSTSNGTEFEYSGEYVQQSNYLKNEHLWFLSVDGRSSLEYLGGHWSVVRRDLDLDNDEDVILIHRDETKPSSMKWLLLSPQNASWYLLYDEVDIVVSINCMDTIPPTSEPTTIPTAAPVTTESLRPIWTDCTDNWFSFVTPSDYATDSYGVYWKEPTAKGASNESVTVVMMGDLNITQGDALDLGYYNLDYRVESSLNASLFRDCNISLFVIGNAQYSTLSYCYDSGFVINANFNETYFEQSATQFEAAEVISISGYAMHPDLSNYDENCYVFGQQMINFTETILEESDAQSFLGIEADEMVWDIAICVIVCCLLSLCLFKICEYCLECRQRRKEKAESRERLLTASEFENNANVDEDDDDINLSDIHHQQNTTGSPLLSANVTNDGLEPGSSSNGKQLTNATNPNLTAIQEKNDGVDAAINVLIGDEDEFEQKDIEGGGGTVEMQKISSHNLVKSMSMDDDEVVGLELAANKQPPPPQPAFSEKQIVSGQNAAVPPPVPAAAFAQQPEQKTPPIPPMNKVESDDEDDEFDSDSEFEFQV